MRRERPCWWWWVISIPEEIRAGVRRFRRWDKALADEQVTWAVTQISFKRSVAVPVQFSCVWARVRMGGKWGSAWLVDSVSSRRHRAGDLCHRGQGWRPVLIKSVERVA